MTYIYHTLDIPQRYKYEISRIQVARPGPHSLTFQVTLPRPQQQTFTVGRVEKKAGGALIIMEAVYHLETWYQQNRDLFSPPVCNKLMHKKQLSVMFVGGPNTRTDFHLEQGSEFFWMVRGNMELPTIQQGQRKLVKINEGEVFLLPSRIPHSPQRPEEGSLGLVIERERYLEEQELDGLRWYVDFNNCDQILWEKYFHCYDLGRDLVPVVKEYHASEEKQSRVPGGNVCDDGARPLQQDTQTSVPDPFNLNEWIEAHGDELASGASIPLFGADHPDKEITVLIIGGASRQELPAWKGDTWMYQIKGNICVTVEGSSPQQIFAGHCGVVPAGKAYVVERDAGSIGMVITQDWLGNKSAAASAATEPESKKQRTE